MKYAILIDAGFLKRKLGSHSEPLDIGGVHAFLAALRAQEALADMRLHRVYWYDAPPLESRVAKPLLGGRINFGATADMRLGLDIAALTLKSHVGAFVLVAGDSDFVPAMKFARREGAQLFLVTLGHSVRADMLEHSDLLLDIPVGGATVIPTYMRRDGARLKAQVSRSSLPVD
jgi:hypothetical protein